MNRKLVWLDCDPGHDDSMAIMLAGHNKLLKLIGISTVAGNQTVDKTTLNALKTLHISGLDDIDVVKGQEKPLVSKGKMFYSFFKFLVVLKFMVNQVWMDQNFQK